MKHLYFVRHGLSVMNQQGLFSGITDTPLADEGRQQCHAAGQKLRHIGIDCIVASPITRALDTATIIASELGYDPARIVINDLFIERDFGSLEGTEYKTGLDLNAIEGVEHTRSVIDRVDEGLQFLRDLPADNILVVSHGAIGRALRYLLQDETAFHDGEMFPNGEVVKLI